MFEYFINSLIFGGGMILISYPSFAASQFLPIGRMFDRHGTGLAALGFGVIILSLGVTFLQGGFLWAIGVAVIGFLAGFIFSILLKSWVQLMGLVLTVFGFVYILAKQM